MDRKVTLTSNQNTRFVKVLRDIEPEPTSPGRDEDDELLPIPAKKTDAELVDAALFNHISGFVLNHERREAKDNVPKF